MCALCDPIKLEPVDVLRLMEWLEDTLTPEQDETDETEVDDENGAL